MHAASFILAGFFIFLFTLFVWLYFDVWEFGRWNRFDFLGSVKKKVYTSITVNVLDLAWELLTG
jgi:hypothetical protein